MIFYSIGTSAALWLGVFINTADIAEHAGTPSAERGITPRITVITNDGRALADYRERGADEIWVAFGRRQKRLAYALTEGSHKRRSHFYVAKRPDGLRADKRKVRKNARLEPAPRQTEASRLQALARAIESFAANRGKYDAKLALTAKLGLPPTYICRTKVRIILAWVIKKVRTAAKKR